MKKYVLTLLIFLSLETNAAFIITTSIIDSIGISPDLPMETDSINISVFGSEPPGVLGLGTAIDIQENDIFLDIFFTGLDAALPTTFPVTPFRIDFSIGQLGAGTYHITANAYDDGVVYNTIPKSFVVLASVPVPASIWLFFSGILGLGFIRQRRECLS